MSTNQQDKLLAERLRNAVVSALLDAWEDAGIRGLCGEGRFEVAVEAVRNLDLDGLIEEEKDARPS